VKIAVAQHVLRPTPAQDLEALVAVAARAASAGVDVIVLPAVEAVHDGPLADELWRRLEEDVPGAHVVVAGDEAASEVTSDQRGAGPLGRVVSLAGDDSIDSEALAAARASLPDVALLAPRSEGELQAQAVLELAIELSTSLAPIIIIAEPDGAELGEPGHGGSAIVHLGEVIAEAMSGDDLLYAEVSLPTAPLESRVHLPAIPPVLAQRLGAHRGHKLVVDYPADLD
jgi:predicted amidohydrolase